ncbi:MAG: phosphonopyruvate decarboxylase [Candidatus Marinimicrobia bacterium]|jgi:phosphonopyruvate decarboxylase|nr:phosphonopyruvate decarboxylase [Candidatus Neomarinimicrobiota bacterium]MDP6500094.1 phosphonopyruvate decarboxylase [Candidatus Neomarinimicrobiota bacterium]MDP6726822.1 phosphonopyruvate decarboxylase [Candidatus Neomarinimicrobiota bacterium]|tara:strand:+ start:9458 stop:10588 length:1131 start_codon:yes stop_codon:yes gene_type:complete
MAIKPTDFYDQLASHGVEFFTGVPDSLLKEFCLCIDDRISNDKHIIAANEGNAVALASGYYLAQESIPLVYMQNSGLGNAVNPLLSLCDPDVYSIPLLVMIGWRGEPGVKDEPQHVTQGRVQIELLEALGLPYEIISKDDDQFSNKISNVIEIARNENKPVVLLIKKGTFEKYKNEIVQPDDQRMNREEALEIILENLDDNSIIVSTTGKTSREIFEIREKRGQTHEQDFLTVGSMGHCSSIALGIALAKPHREVVCIDGDGAMLMHLGSLTSIASMKPKNFRHILMNNEVHESVGGQETAAKNLDLSAIVEAVGSSKVFKAATPNDLKTNITNFITCSGPSFLEVKIKPGSREDLGRPTVKPVDNKENFMKFLNK